MKRLSAAAAACLLLLAGCGGGNHPHSEASTSHTGATGGPVLRVACPPGRSFMGCAQPHPVGVGRTVGLAPAGCKFPDVSSFQGHPDWPAVKAWQTAAHCTAGAVFKLGEFVEDPDASFNAGKLHALGMTEVGYWFVRPTGCAHESAQIITVARGFGLHVVVLDIEVPGIAGYAACLSAPLKAAGFVVVIYTGSGTWPGGSSAGLPVWVAAYGPSSAPSLFGERPVAWQETDGHFGFPVDVPGLGDVDVNIDMGLLALAAPPKPKPSKAQVAKWKRAAAASSRAYTARDCPVLEQRIRWFTARERGRLASKHRRAARASEHAFTGRDCGVFAQRTAYFDLKLKEA